MKWKSAILMLLIAGAGYAQSAPSVVGTWEGDSVCQVPKPCTTEQVVYEFTQNSDGTLRWKADKVVYGKRESMGQEFTCSWSASEQKLTCPMEGRRPADWVLWLRGDRLLGALTIREGKIVYRKISVQRKQ
jgi:hypothetical protein